MASLDESAGNLKRGQFTSRPLDQVMVRHEDFQRLNPFPFPRATAIFNPRLGAMSQEPTPSLDEHSRVVDELIGHCDPQDGRIIECGKGLIVVGFTNRSGSTLLCSALAALGLAGATDGFNNYEYLNSNRAVPLVERYAPRDFECLLQEIVNVGRGPRGWTTLKVSPGQLQHLIVHGVWSRLRPAPTLLIAQRQDVVRQAVSLALAQQDGRWTSLHEGRIGARYHYESDVIRNLYQSIVRERTLLEEILAETGLAAERFTYEIISRSRQQLASRLAEKFKVEDSPDWSVLPVQSQDLLRKRWWTARVKVRNCMHVVGWPRR